jgi:hypothetical protein
MAQSGTEWHNEKRTYMTIKKPAGEGAGNRKKEMTVTGKLYRGFPLGDNYFILRPIFASIILSTNV